MANMGPPANLRTLNEIKEEFPFSNDQDEFLTYQPETDRSNNSYDYYFDLLGFNEGRPMRDDLQRAINSHVMETAYRFLRKRDNRVAFEAITKEFLRAHGYLYWGPWLTRRTHLTEPNILKGFLYPRDAETQGSRLVQVIEALFDWRAGLRRWEDSKRVVERQVVPKLDFERMTGFTTDAHKLCSMLKQTGSPAEVASKRLVMFSDPTCGEESHLGNSSTTNVLKRKQSHGLDEYRGSLYDQSPTNSPPHSASKSSVRARRQTSKPGFVDIWTFPDLSEADLTPYKGQPTKKMSDIQMQESPSQFLIRPKFDIGRNKRRETPSQSDNSMDWVPEAESLTDHSQIESECSLSHDRIDQQPQHQPVHAEETLDSSSTDEGPLMLTRQKQIEVKQLPIDGQHRYQNESPLWSNPLEPPPPTPSPSLRASVIKHRQDQASAKDASLGTTTVSLGHNILQRISPSLTKPSSVYHQQQQQQQDQPHLNTRPHQTHPHPSSSTIPSIPPHQSIPSPNHFTERIDLAPIRVDNNDNTNPNPNPTLTLPHQALAQTLLQVTDNLRKREMNPVPIPLLSCMDATSDRLFAACMAARGIASTKTVDYLNVRFTWSGKQFCLKRGNAFLWEFFVGAVRKGWQRWEGGFLTAEFGAEVEVEVWVVG